MEMNERRAIFILFTSKYIQLVVQILDKRTKCTGIFLIIKGLLIRFFLFNNTPYYLLIVNELFIKGCYSRYQHRMSK